MGAFAFLLFGCSDPPAAPAPPPPEVIETAPAALLPERALAYVPGDSLTDRRIAEAQAAVRTSPGRVDALDGLAILFFRRHRETADGEHLRRAQELVDLALGVQAEDPVALELSGLLAMQAHRFAEARDIAGRILAIDRQDTTALLLLGDAQSELGEYDASVDAYQRASDLRPDLRTYNRGAYTRWLHGDPAGALELLALSIDSGSVNDPEATAWCWVDLATVHWHLGNRDRARIALDRALALVPDYLPAMRLEARLLASEGRFPESVTVLTAALERQELVGELLFLSEVLDAEGLHDEAAARVARAIEMRREDPRSLAFHRSRHGVEAEDALETTQSELRRRHDIYTRAALALALTRAGRRDDAHAEMDRALALGTPDVGLMLTSGLIAHLGGNDVEARATLARVRALNPFVDRFVFDALASELGESAAVPTPIVLPTAAPVVTP